MLALTLALLASTPDVPRSARLLDDAPLLAQVSPGLAPAPSGLSDAEVSAQQLQADILALRRSRPSLGGGIGLSVAGGATVLAGALYLAIGFGLGGISNPLTILGIAAMVIGLPMTIIGSWLLYNRIGDRQRIDKEIARLEAESRSRFLRRQEQSPPPAPGYQAPPPPSLPPQVLVAPPTMVVATF